MDRPDDVFNFADLRAVLADDATAVEERLRSRKRAASSVLQSSEHKKVDMTNPNDTSRNQGGSGTGRDPPPPTPSSHAIPPEYRLTDAQLNALLQSVQGRKSSEIRLNPPAQFDGDPRVAREFLQSCRAYLLLNAHVYQTDMAKVLFVLSFMRSGPAAEWAFYWQEQIQKGEVVIWTIFLSDFEKAFISADVPAEARAKLLSLKQTGTADE